MQGTTKELWQTWYLGKFLYLNIARKRRYVGRNYDTVWPCEIVADENMKESTRNHGKNVLKTHKNPSFRRENCQRMIAYVSTEVYMEFFLKC